jgi:ABC-type sugar transport system ATPase subunit
MLRIENLSKDMGEFILRDVSLDVNDGEYLVIIGPTGAGKTILLETVAGIYAPDSGRIRLDDRDITDERPKDRNICMVYQDYMLFPHLTVKENIGFGLSPRSIPAAEIDAKIGKFSDLLGISHLLHRYPDTLSGGEQQRTAIARAVVMEPRALLLDEPLSALDAKTREMLRQELKLLHAVTRTTVIHITHNFEEVFELADRVAIMHEGRIVQIGEPDEIFRRPNSRFVADFVGTVNVFRGTCSIRDGTGCVEVNGTTIRALPAAEGDVYVSIRPEDILVSKRPLEASVRNVIPGTVEALLHVGAMVRLTVDAGLQFLVLLTRQGFEDLEIGKGDAVWIAFKAASVHVFPRGQEDDTASGAASCSGSKKSECRS